MAAKLVRGDGGLEERAVCQPDSYPMSLICRVLTVSSRWTSSMTSGIGEGAQIKERLVA
jgi:hypothetical protein